MNIRHVDISPFVNEFIISCFDGKQSTPVFQYTTNRLEVVPVICREYIEHDCTEEYLTTILERII